MICDTANDSISTFNIFGNKIYSANYYGDKLLTLSEDNTLRIWDNSFDLLKSVKSIGTFTKFISVCSNGDLLIPQVQNKSTCVIHRLPIDYILKHPSYTIEFNSIPKFQAEAASTQQLSLRK